MAEPGREPDLSVKPEEYLEVISTDDERIKIIGEELANDNGRAIFGKISQGVTSSNEIAKSLGISLPLVNWHVNRLMGVGLIKVEKVEMSQKNKQMKYYGPVKTALVIVPAEKPGSDKTEPTTKDSVLARLRNYMASIAAFAAGSSGIYLIEKNQAQQTVQQTPAQAPSLSMHAAMRAAPMAAPAPVPPPPLGGDLMALLIAIAGGGAFFAAVYIGMKWLGRNKSRS